MAEPKDRIELNMKPDGEYTIGLMLGHQPYVLITVDLVEAEDAVSVQIETGGGIPQDVVEFADLLRKLADTLTGSMKDGDAVLGFIKD